MGIYTSAQLLILVTLSLVFHTYAENCTLPHLNNAVIDSPRNSYGVGENVTYACKAGYYMHYKSHYVDKLQRNCLGYGKWDGSFLSCNHYDVFRNRVISTNLRLLWRQADEGKNACLLMDLKHDTKLNVNLSKHAYELIHIVLRLESQSSWLHAISLSVFLELEKRRLETAYECTYEISSATLPFSVQLPADVHVTCKLTGHTSAQKYSTIAQIRLQAREEAKHALLSLCSLKGLVYHGCDSENLANESGDTTSNRTDRRCSSYEEPLDKCGKLPSIQNGHLREIQDGTAILECDVGFFPRPENKYAFCNEFTSWHWTWNVTIRGHQCIPIDTELMPNGIHTRIFSSGSNESEKREDFSTLLDLNFSIYWYYPVMAVSLLAFLFCVGCTTLCLHVLSNETREHGNVIVKSARCDSFVENYLTPSTSASNVNYEIDVSRTDPTPHLHLPCVDSDGYEVPL